MFTLIPQNLCLPTQILRVILMVNLGRIHKLYFIYEALLILHFYNKTLASVASVHREKIFQHFSSGGGKKNYIT